MTILHCYASVGLRPPEAVLWGITERIEDVSSYVTLRAMADTAVAYSAGVLILTNYRLVFVTEPRLQRVDLGFHVGAEFNHEVGQRISVHTSAHTCFRSALTYCWWLTHRLI